MWLRVPFEVKAQRVSFRVIEPVTFEQVLAQLRHTEIHHRTETYAGLSDLMLLVAHRWRGLLVERDSLTVAGGFTLPTGQTERDPYKAGDAGQEHLHLQFGSGTLDPLLEAYYVMPLPADVSLGAYATGRFPFYENRKTYQAPVEATAGLRVGYAPTPWLELGGDVTAYWQAYGYWDGHRDENSGLVSFLAALTVRLRLGGGFVLNLGVRFPIAQRTLSDDEDAFEQGPSLLFSLSWQLPGGAPEPEDEAGGGPATIR